MSNPDLVLALHLADRADEVSSRRFGTVLEVARKPGGSLVTDVDREIQALLVEALRRERPDDDIVGEEGTDRVVSARRCWLIDPIDGTESFVAGRSTWGTLISLAVDRRPILGVASAPALDMRWWGESTSGAWSRRLSTRGPDQRLSVSSLMAGAEMRIGVIGHEPTEEVIAALSAVGTTTREGLGPLGVAAGELDAAIVVTAPCTPWNLASFAAVVEAAGGDFFDATGGADLDTGLGIFTSGGDHLRQSIAKAIT